ncbi:MAG: hypothetical protein HY549_07605, partial [Elusimicrobia bacterium]|nr:hypothetical protein [Elusimicrobiota bacterium]
MTALKGGVVIFIIALAVAQLGSENITLSTYYPAPSGIYTRIITTGDTILARDGGRVGIGTASPSAKLEVAGTAHITGQLRIEGGSPGAGKTLVSDATGLGSWQDPPGAGSIPRGVVAFTAVGPFSFTVPPGVTRLLVEVYGAGGGGGSGGNAAGAGGAGGVAVGLLTVSEGQVINGAIGAGGVAGNTGATGGTSFFGTLSATGGLGGRAGGGYSGLGAPGGIGSGGAIIQKGGPGGRGGYAGHGFSAGGSNLR